LRKLLSIDTVERMKYVINRLLNEVFGLIQFTDLTLNDQMTVK